MGGKQKIEAGNRYIKVGAVQPVIWVVDKILDTPGLPRHVRLIKETGRDSTTVAVDALMNPRFFRPAE